LPDYIHPSQQAFIEGRRISNNIIIAQEVTHSFALKSWKNQAFMLKIDLAKLSIDLNGISLLLPLDVKECMLIS
jgi:hypothetical protein